MALNTMNGIASRQDIGMTVETLEDIDAPSGDRYRILDFRSHRQTGKPFAEYLVRIELSPELAARIDIEHLATQWVPIYCFDHRTATRDAAHGQTGHDGTPANCEMCHSELFGYGDAR